MKSGARTDLASIDARSQDEAEAKKRQATSTGGVHPQLKAKGRAQLGANLRQPGKRAPKAADLAARDFGVSGRSSSLASPLIVCLSARVLDVL